MNYVLAIDVGTSFTAAATVRTNQNAQPVPESLRLGLRGMAVPSVVFYPAEGPILVGEPAERRGLDSPERVVREFKRRVGDEVPISVGTLLLPAEEVFATMARWVVDRAQEREGAPPSDIVLTHPASWGAHRTDLILRALVAKGLADVTLVSEPEAAALHYASQTRVEDGSTIAVYDLGGGTFDTAVLRKAGAGHFELLGRPEGIEGLGGADFDAAVLRHVAEHTGQALAGLDTSAPATLAALARLRRECVEAKEALSSDSETNISVLLPGVQQQVRLVRSEFEAMIDGPIRETVDALETSLQELGLTPADLSAVLLIGGSSRIPLVAQLISEQLDRPIAVDADPKSSICLGAAVSTLQRAATAQPLSAAVVPLEAEAKAPDAGTVGTRSLPSWSRKTPTASPAGSAAGGVHNSGRKAGTARGAHAPRASVRLTAVAAAAALFTGLSATAAQSPDGFGSLSALLVPGAEANAAPKNGTTPDSGSGLGGSGTGSVAAGGVGGAQVPEIGIEASAKEESGAAASNAGLDVEASPTWRRSASTNPPAAGGAGSGADSTGGGAAASLPGGTSGGATGGTAPGSGGAGTGALPPADTAVPPDTPSPLPSDMPVPSVTPLPSDMPVPSDTPSPEPTVTPVPSDTPSPEPTDTPVPSDTPSPVPSETAVPTETPSPAPSETAVPTGTPSPSETAVPLTTTDTETPAPILPEPAV